MIEDRSQPTRAYILYTTYIFCTLFLINFLLPSGYPLNTPPNFLFFMTHLRLTLTTPFHDSHSQLPFVTCCFAPTPSCDPTTDGRTVSTPQRHLPSVPTLTLITNFFWYLLYCLAPPSSFYPPPCPPPLVDLCLLTLPLAHPLLQRPLPPMPGPLTPSPHLSPPLLLPPFPLYGNMSLQY